MAGQGNLDKQVAQGDVFRSQAARLPLTGLLLLQPELDALSSAPDFEASAFSTQKPSYHLA